jgi:ribosomal protein S18 acetylase RimI-like enzyme
MEPPLVSGMGVGDRNAARRTALRASTPADEPFLTRVYADTRAAELALLGWSAEQQASFLASQSSFQQRAYAAGHPGSGFEIVLLDDTPIGRLFVARGSSELRVVDIALLAEHRGAGIGTELLLGVLAEAAARGVGVGLEVDLSNPARRLYARLGFVVEGTTQIQASLRWTPPGSPARGDQVKAAS